MSKQRDSFIFYRSFFESTLPLDKEQKAELFDAICNYALDGKIIEINGIAKGFFTLIKPQLDANRKKWVNGCKEKSKKEVGEEQKESKSEAKHKQEESKSEGNVNVNVECKLESKSKLKIINEKYNILADGLIFVLEAKMNKKLSAGSQKNYAEEIRKLIEIDLSKRTEPEEDVKRAIQAIGDNYGKDYFPIIQSGGSFREKFVKIEDYLKRTQNSKKTEIGDIYQNLMNKYRDEENNNSPMLD